jgi:hypothetical protein
MDPPKITMVAMRPKSEASGEEPATAISGPRYQIRATTARKPVMPISQGFLKKFRIFFMGPRPN